jgi:hypothetical protein
VTALSFLLPALAALAVRRGEPGAARRRALALALAVMVTLAGPYLLSCALAFGDPLHAVNHHTRFYRSRTGQAHATDMSATAWLRSGFAPGELVATGASGLTTYPFRNKFRGLDDITPMLRRVLAPAALVGLVLLAFSGAGRLLLLVLFSSLLPYAFTWKVAGGSEWRFTMHAYGFYLVAACAVVPLAIGLAGRVRRARAVDPGPAPP